MGGKLDATEGPLSFMVRLPQSIVIVHQDLVQSPLNTLCLSSNYTFIWHDTSLEEDQGSGQTACSKDQPSLYLDYKDFKSCTW